MYSFSNRRSLTKSILAWWALNNQNQPRPSIKESFDVEHIYSRNRCEKEHDIVDKKIIELLGNKILLEKRINIRASDYRFIDKAVYYRGDGTKKNEGTQIIELRTMAENIYDFTEREIKNRNERIIIEFLNYLRKNKLTKELDDSSLF